MTEFSTPILELYSATVCPYAHRSRLVLLEKGIEFKLIEIDLQNKPVGFTEISPYGKVPALKFGSERVWESAIINEYLNEVFPDPPLLPSTPIGKAQARIWIDFANTRLIPTYTDLLRSPDATRRQEAGEELQQHLCFIEQEGLQKLSDQGPYWFGETISLVDLTLYPWFERWPVVEHYRNLQFPAECSRLKQWWQTVSQRTSVKSIANSQDFYIQRYASYVAPH